MRKTRIYNRILALALSLLIASVTLGSCAEQKKKHSKTYFEYFDTFCTLTVYSTKKDFDKYNELFASELEKYHRLLDAYNTYDGVVNIHSLNENASGKAIEVSDELFELLERSVEICDLTEGYTRITLGSLTSVWKQAIKDKTVPDSAILTEASKHTDVSVLELNRENKTARLCHTDARLDAGALAKGYVSDKLRATLVEAGCESFLINLGGNLSSHGKNDKGVGYTASIEDPITQRTLNTVIDLTDRTLSTSGSYNRGFEENGIKYHHIIDPYTAFPKNVYVSVSVIYSDGTTADALSTALFSLDYENGRALIDSLDGAQAIWIFADGEIRHTDGITLN